MKKFFLISLSLLLINILSCNNRHMPLNALPNSPQGNPSSKLGYDGPVRAVFNKCLTCHGPGSFRDWSTYENIFKFKDIIYRRLVQEKTMPPLNASVKVTDDERRLIGQWIESGAPRDVEASNPSDHVGSSVPSPEPPAVEPPATPSSPVAKCAACHGETGVSVLPDVPNLAGQNPNYIKTQIENFKTKQRLDHTMNVMEGMASSLTDEEIKNIINFYSQQKKPSSENTFTPEEQIKIDEGKTLAQTYCLACHAPNGTNDTPSLAGQQKNYIFNQLTAFKDGLRVNPIMSGIVSGIDKDKFEALAYYFSSLAGPVQSTTVGGAVIDNKGLSEAKMNSEKNNE